MICNQIDKSSPPDFFRKWGNTNRVTFSSLDEWGDENYTAETIGIKYVVEGTEHYYINDRRFSVSAGNFLVVNRDQPIDTYVQSRKPVSGFCLHLQEELVMDVGRNMMESDDQLLADPFHFPGSTMFEPVLYSDQDNDLGIYLREIAKNFDKQTGAISIERDELFYQLAMRLLRLNQNTRTIGKEWKVLRNSTRIELLRRLKLAKELIDSDVSRPLNVEEIAREAMLSQSHFLYNFKKVYKISPYQYSLRRRLSYAADMLLANEKSIGDIAINSGFADAPSFSKAFRQRYGKSPVQFRMSR